MATDPLHQFVIEPLVPIHIGGLDLSFTNSALFMVATVVAAAGWLLLATHSRRLVPGKFQSSAELVYEFVSGTLRQAAGSQGMKFFPLVFTLFMFILLANLWGMFPYFFTVTSHIIVTAAMAFLVIGVVIFYGFYKNGFGFLRLFVPHGVPKVLLPFITFIEVLSFVSRPISLSIRLFANMLAGHITLKVFAGFVVTLGALGATVSVDDPNQAGMLADWGFIGDVIGFIAALLPLIMAVALTALEFLVAALQAYVFAILTSLYINDAIHPSH